MEHQLPSPRFKSMKTNILLSTLVLLLAACQLPTPVTPTPLPTLTPAWTIYPSPVPSSTFTLTPVGIPSETPTLPPTVATQLTHAPGLLVRGRVTFDGAGLAGVSIYRRYSAYPPVLIAVTDADGYYQSEFMNIPGDEMVTILAELAGYIFDPPYVYWRHYYGYEETTCDFTALLTP